MPGAKLLLFAYMTSTRTKTSLLYTFHSSFRQDMARTEQGKRMRKIQKKKNVNKKRKVVKIY